MKRLFISITLFAFASFPLIAAKKPTLCVGNYHSEADAVKQLARLAATHSNLSDHAFTLLLGGINVSLQVSNAMFSRHGKRNCVVKAS